MFGLVGFLVAEKSQTSVPDKYYIDSGQIAGTQCDFPDGRRIVHGTHEHGRTPGICLTIDKIDDLLQN